MSYSTDPVVDAARHYDAIDAYQAGQQQAERAMAAEFLKLIRAGDMHAPATFAAREKDYEASRAAGGDVLTHPTISSLVQDLLELRHGVPMSEILGILAKVAYGADSQQQAARELIERMAHGYATYYANFEGDL